MGRHDRPPCRYAVDQLRLESGKPVPIADREATVDEPRVDVGMVRLDRYDLLEASNCGVEALEREQGIAAREERFGIIRVRWICSVLLPRMRRLRSRIQSSRSFTENDSGRSSTSRYTHV